MSERRKFILFEILADLAFLLGAVIGVFFGLSFAPKKGADFRRDLSEKYKKGGVKKAGEYLLSTGKVAGSEALAVTRQTIEKSELSNRAAKKIKNLAAEARAEMDHAAGQVNSAWRKKIIPRVKKSAQKLKKIK